MQYGLRADGIMARRCRLRGERCDARDDELATRSSEAGLARRARRAMPACVTELASDARISR